MLIAGCGAVGSYYGGRLAAAGNAVTFWARGAHLAALRSDGLRIRSIDGDAHIRNVRAVSAVPAEPFDAVLIAVKAYQTAEIVAAIAPAVGPDTVVLSLQNGIDNEEAIAAAYGAHRTVGGVAFIGSERTAPGEVTHTAAGGVAMGPWAPAAADGARRLHDQFVAAGVRSRYCDDIRWELWTKLMWNAGFNPTTALAGLSCHGLLATPAGEAVVRRAMAEIRAVAAAEGIVLANGAEDEYITRTRTMGDVRTSMMVDRERGRHLEVEAICGTIVRRGARHGVATPVQQTLYELLAAYDRSVTAD